MWQEIFYWVEVHHQTYGYLKCLMFDLEWRLAELCNMEDHLAAPDCHRFPLLLKASRIVRNIQETFEAALGETSRLKAESLFLIKKRVYRKPSNFPPRLSPHARASKC